MLSQEGNVFKEGLVQLNDLMDNLDTLYTGVQTSRSVLLQELAATDNPLEALYDSKQTPIVHALSAVHAYINVFIYLSRGAQVCFVKKISEISLSTYITCICLRRPISACIIITFRCLYFGFDMLLVF